jgi:hypothetical protein
MKNVLCAIFALSLLTACSNPVLKWIDTPEESEGIRSGAKEITAFSFGISGESVIIGSEPDSNEETPIWVILPAGTGVEALTPTIVYSGKSLNPFLGRSMNFSVPRLYMVTAEDGSTREYLVRVHVKDSSSKAILHFALVLPSDLVAEGSINENAGTIAIGVPAGTNLKSISARIVHSGVSLTDPYGGSYSTAEVNLRGDFSDPTQWTVTGSDNGQKNYEVTVTERASSDKEITAFSLDLNGESVVIGSEPRSDGKYPILVFVSDPGVTQENLVGLTPGIKYKGDSIIPEGTAQNFKDPNQVVYRVVAKDGSSRDYVVRVVLKETAGSSDKWITGFYFTDPLIEGVINESAGSINLTVPYEMDLSNQRPEIYYLGASVRPNSGQLVDFSGAETSPVAYTVTDQAGETKIYAVTVNKRKSSDKEIKAFGFDIVGESVTISSEPQPDGKYLILAFVPDVTAADLAKRTPVLVYKGVSISPGEGTLRNFSDSANPAVYRVTAADGSSRDYVVRVVLNETGGSSDPRITGFYFTDPLIEGMIDESARTIVLTVPQGTNPVQRPEIYFIGDSIDPERGELVDFSSSQFYKVTDQDDNTKIYTVTMNKRKSSDKEITAFDLGFTGESVTISSEPQPDGKYLILAFVPSAPAGSLDSRAPATLVHNNGSSITPGQETPQNFNNPASPVVYTVTAEDGSSRDYVVRVVLNETGGSSDRRITGFYFTDPLIEGMIDETLGTISLTVPQGTNNSQRPEIYYQGASVSPSSGQLVDFSKAGTTPVAYTVTAQNGTPRIYNVTVTVTKQKSSDREITAFGLGIPGESVVIGSAPQLDGRYPILVSVPGADAGSFVYRTPALVYKGSSISPGKELAQDFSNSADPVVYRVTAEDGNFRDYVIRIVYNEITGSSDKQITGFYFTNPLIEGVINESARTIVLTVPYETDLSNQRPEIYYLGASISPAIGQAVDFNNATPVTYTVTARDNTKKTYTVTVNKRKSSDKEITAFGFDIVGESVTISSEPQPDGKYLILAFVPGATSANLASRAPTTLDHKGISIIPAKGIAQNFSNSESPVVYRVTAEDGSSRDYVVRVVLNETVGSSDKRITGFYFTNPLIEGVINESAGSINLTVPPETNTIQSPEIYYLGTSISPTPGQLVDFSSPQLYTVTDQSGGTKIYTVTVNKQKSSDREITAFGLGLPGESVVIGSAPQPDGRYPILVSVSGADAGSLANRIPVLDYKGISISPGKELAQDFSNSANPVVYRVTAEDGNVRDYVIRIVFNETAGSSDKQITGFYFTDPLIEGVINESARTIVLTIPQGTGTFQRPEIYYQGASISPTPGQGVDFSSSQLYMVTARDGTQKTYTVTVNKRKSSDKEITAFGLGFTGESVAISSEPQPDGKYLILTSVPGATSASLANRTPTTLVYKGISISPGKGDSRDFSNPANPVVYRVTAEDGSSRDYVIKVVLNGTGESSNKQITGFYFTDPLIEGVINESTETIVLTVPPGTNTLQRPEIYYLGASISPASGQAVNFNNATPVTYTVTAEDGTKKTYAVTVNKQKSSDKEITAFGLGFTDERVTISSEPQPDGKYLILAFVPSDPAGSLANQAPTTLVYKGDSISPGEGAAQNFNNPAVPVVYKVTAEDGSSRDYVIKVVLNEIVKSSDKQITGFYFTNPLIEGVISESAKTIVLTVPHETDLSNQRPEIYYLGASISPTSGTLQDFNNATPVKYTVTAEDSTKETYTVTVNKRKSSDKEITAFGLGFTGESVTISSEPQPDGKYLILAFVPSATSANLDSRAPTTLVHKGSSISPEKGIPQNFSNSESPVVYRVTAEDGSSRDYVVRVVFNETVESSDKQITGFYFTDPLIEGVINESAGTIVLTVPQGTNSVQRPEIYYIGASISPASGAPQDFNNATPVKYTVTDQGGKTKAYTVVVNKRKSSDKEITAFGFGIAGESVIIGSQPQPDGKYPILVFVSSATAADLVNRTPGLVYRGSFISPGQGTPENFSNPASPVVYTVTAEDNSSRDYVIRVVFKETTESSDKQITGFYFADPLIEGVINESAGTIALTVPQGTNTIQRPEIYYLGASISPMIGQPVDFSNAGTASVAYTVSAQDKSSKTYKVSVSTVAVPTPPVVTVQDSGNEKVDIGIDAGSIDTGGGGGGSGNISDSGNYTVVVEMPIHIDNPVININYPGAGNTVNIGSIDASKITNTTNTENISLENNYLNITNNDVFNYVPIKLINDNSVTNDNDEYLYVLAVNPPSSGEPAPKPEDPDYEARQAAASIDGFYFASPVAVGTIGKTDGTEGAGTPENPYRIAVKVPYGTNLRNLAATICYTGKEIVGIPGANPLKAGSRSFTNPVDYTVSAYDTKITKTYRVTVTSALNTAKDITAFAFSGVNPAGTNTVIGAVPNAEGDYPILITVPAGTALGNLTPVITHTGYSINPTATAADFSDPVKYTVTAADGSTKTYAVTALHVGDGADDIEITGFYFTTPLAAGMINQNTNTITVIVPSTTNTANLVPSLYFKGMTVNPGSNRANNFNGPVLYTVTGINGKTRSYTVTVTKTPSSSKDLTSFDFPGVAGSETIIGAVPDAYGNYPVSVWVPAGTDLSNLSPDIVYSGISIGPASGAPQNFNNPQTYIITAEDGSTKTYKVTTTPLDGDSKLITSLVFNEVPLSGGGTIRALGAIDQGKYTITATVPSTADIRGLAPTITYIGRSIVGPSGGDQTANPFTDAARNFFGVSQTYTVKDQNGKTQIYTVRVSRQSAVTVAFMGNVDRTVIGSNVFDQTTGIITISANTAETVGVGPPYEWYVDGVKQGVSSTESVFTLNVGTGNFTPGRHEIMLSGRANGLHYTGKVSFTVAGGSK